MYSQQNAFRLMDSSNFVSFGKRFSTVMVDGQMWKRISVLSSSFIDILTVGFVGTTQTKKLLLLSDYWKDMPFRRICVAVVCHKSRR